MKQNIKNIVLEKFLRYIAVDSRSNEDTAAHPSTAGQFILARTLVDELMTLGLHDATVDEHCYVMATLPSNVEGTFPVTGLIAHLDTSPELPGACVNPRVIHSYDGNDIKLGSSGAVVIKCQEDPYLKDAIGHTLVVTDGTTLLGADDKAGVTAVMVLLEYLNANPQIPHGTIRIGFTPDEEIGQGADLFDIEKFGADVAYTIDGGFSGEYNDETFSANEAVIEITGRDIHPGSAKNVMVNAIRVASEIISRLPENMAPETTDEYQGYIHPRAMESSISHVKLKLLLRSFSDDELLIQEKLIKEILSHVQGIFPGAIINLSISETYRNMKPVIDRHPEIIQRLEAAIMKAGVIPCRKPIRGGTDGSRLSAMGLPTPNIFTGGVNAHSLTEWLSVDVLVKVVDVLKNIVSTD
ncbi:MAG TPA: peptidase T [Chitinispirillaceae bacterium]|nr:peptidase T [Chitinispirillaceae bacterium]